jgi:hypothetical protein
MSDDPNPISVPPGGLHHLQVKLAFLADPDHRARPAALITSTGPDMAVRYIDDGTTETITVNQPDRLAAIVARDDLCRIGGLPLLLVNTHYRVLGVATGPVAPPPHLEVLVVSHLEHGAVVELVNGSDTQPAWQLLALTGPSWST